MGLENISVGHKDHVWPARPHTAWHTGKRGGCAVLCSPDCTLPALRDLQFLGTAMSRPCHRPQLTVLGRQTGDRRCDFPGLFLYLVGLKGPRLSKGPLSLPPGTELVSGQQKECPPGREEAFRWCQPHPTGDPGAGAVPPAGLMLQHELTQDTDP